MPSNDDDDENDDEDDDEGDDDDDARVRPRATHFNLINSAKLRHVSYVMRFEFISPATERRTEAP